MCLQREKLIEFIKSRLPSSENGPQIIIDLIQNSIDESQKSDQDSLSNYLQWIKNNSNLKLKSSEVPSHILPGAKIHDVRIDSRRNDDAVYDRHADIRSKVARGNTVLEYKDSSGKIIYDLLIFALRKFTGGLGDEDDLDRNTSDWKRYFLKDMSHTKKLISIRKANGEAAHMSCRWINGDFIICGGSKNIHMFFKNERDIQSHTDSCYQVAREVAMTINRFVNKQLEPEIRNAFLSFLCLTKLTVVFEILQPNYQHVEDLSYLSEALLKFITFTESRIDEHPHSLCYFPPHLAIELGKVFELSVLDFEVVDYDSIGEYLHKIREDYGHEGVVIYFLDEKENVIGMLKKKTTWYIVLRAIREKIRSFISPKSSQSISEFETRVRKRLKDIQSWIGFGDEYRDQWIDWAVMFMKWLEKKIKSSELTPADFYSTYPKLWTRFIREHHINDHIKLHVHVEEGI